jgi:hypothetical protein
VLGGELGESAAPERRQPQPNGPLVMRIRPSPHQPGRLRPVHQLHHTMVAKQQMTGHVSDRGASRIHVPPHREEELVLGRGQTRGLGLLLTPPQEQTKPISQTEQL